MNDLEQITRHVTVESRDAAWWLFAAGSVVGTLLMVTFGLPIWLLDRYDDWRYARWADRSMRR